MGLFHVYVEAPDRSPQTIAKLAATIGKKYGVPVADLEKRLAAGRFRVKANVDRATADSYAQALADSGAIVKIEDALPTQPSPTVPRPMTPSSGAPIATAGQEGSGSVARTPAQRIPRQTGAPPELSTPSLQPRPSSSTASPASVERSVGYSMQGGKERAGAPSLPPANADRSGSSSLPPANADRSGPIRSGTSSLPPATTSRPATSSLPPANTARTSTPSLPPTNAARTSTPSLPPATKSTPAVASGLSAAFTEAASADLGALASDPDSFSLLSLDGGDKDPLPSDSFAPPVDMSPHLPPPATVPTGGPATKAAKPKDEPVDLFAPPDAAEDAAFMVELAPDDAAHRAKKMSTPPAGVPTAEPPAPVPTPQLAKKRATPAAGAPITVAADAQETPRWRLAAGVMVAIVLGFLPAHLIASVRERSAFDKIDADIIRTQDAADTPEMYEALDAFREAELELKHSKKRSIAMLSMLIWGVSAGGLAYVWFRRVPWDKVLKKQG
ncbi:MAG: hypothetical protein IPQ07_30495 [Myxococcales bacterium]|nr:hypothetical protein [Myxococcales bacterium]